MAAWRIAGVDMFFVISGFVVTGSLLRKQYPSALAMCSAFYARRVKRLAPSLFATVLIAGTSLAIIVPPAITDVTDYFIGGHLALVGS